MFSFLPDIEYADVPLRELSANYNWLSINSINEVSLDICCGLCLDFDCINNNKARVIVKISRFSVIRTSPTIAKSGRCDNCRTVDHGRGRNIHEQRGNTAKLASRRNREQNQSLL